MTDELIFDGSEIDDQIADAEKWARYELLSEKQLNAELEGVRSRVIACETKLHNMVEHIELMKTQEMFTNLCAQDLSLGGWPVKYVDHNKDMYAKYVDGTGRPNWYEDLTLDVKQTYELNLRYYKDIALLREPCLAINKLIIEMLSDDALGEGFRLIRSARNFEACDINEKDFRNLELVVRYISERLNKDWEVLEDDVAKRSAIQYYKDHKNEPFDKLMCGYRQARTNDYVADLRESPLGERFLANANGTFGERSDMAWKVVIIDKYTYRIASMEQVGDLMEKYDNKCKQIHDAIILPNEKSMTIESVKMLSRTLRYFLTEITDFADLCRGLLKKYKEADVNTSPWCFMHRLSAFDSVKPKYSFKPNTKDPWEKGTEYTKMYEMAAKALGEHCADFVKNHGHSMFRGK